jgi:hypothetical protein
MALYDDLIEEYLQDLRAVRLEVLAWWEGLLRAANPAGDLEAAHRSVRPRWPAGPASHPRVIAIFRKYYLAIDALNEGLRATQIEERLEIDSENWWGRDDDIQDDAILEPRFILLDDLESKDPTLAHFMSRFVFAPIGADPDDETS